jgi:beta-glucosidase
MVDDAGNTIVPAGSYSVSIGGGQPGSGLPGVNGEFSVVGQMRLPE